MVTLHDKEMRVRRQLVLDGVVQGVGFRPFVHRLASSLHLSGFVCNNSAGVLIEVEGAVPQIESFCRRLHSELPPLAKIDTSTLTSLPLKGDADFSITTSISSGAVSTLISADIAVCADCLREMFDPTDRRYRYPFTNCTNCGPRYTIVDNVPYDRSNTSMSAFQMCEICRAEYENVADRRYHAQPVACPACGPRLSWYTDGAIQPDLDPLAETVAYLRAGRIVAIRGLGGFHLAVDATNAAAVLRLRQRKLRAEKPLAIMVADLSVVHQICDVSEGDLKWLLSPVAPIMLLRRKDNAVIAESVAFDNTRYGVMLPYTPLHHLLLKDNFIALVMTSANLSDEPIAIGNEEAISRLGDVADAFLLHDRDILQRCDDSVVMSTAGRLSVMRRARGFVPSPVRLIRKHQQSILACGAELKNTIGYLRGNRFFFSQHIGDLDNPKALQFFEESIEHLRKTHQFEPELIACDLHPDYLSTRWALAQAVLPVMRVQHHHAHLASVLAEHHCDHPAVGIILDGTGYGSDATIWGGEVLIGDTCDFERFAWLQPVVMPGGESAIKHPWKMVISYLSAAGVEDAHSLHQDVLGPIKAEEKRTIQQFLLRRGARPLTSSCGRLFDGISAILGFGLHSSFEAQAAINLEQAALRFRNNGGGALPAATSATPTAGEIDFIPIVRELLDHLLSGIPAERLAFWFHLQLADLFAAVAQLAVEKTGIRCIALSGGVFQNELFTEHLLAQLRSRGYQVLVHSEVPTNDGGLALGQALIAANKTTRTRGV